MASRRNRIKPVVNIPLGRKLEKKSHEDVSDINTVQTKPKVGLVELTDTTLSTTHLSTTEPIDTSTSTASISAAKSIDVFPSRGHLFTELQNEVINHHVERQEVLTDVGTLTAELTNSHHDHKATMSDITETSSIQTTKDVSIIQKPIRRSLIKPKLSLKVLEKSRDYNKISESVSNNKHEVDDSIIVSDCETRAGLIDIVKSAILDSNSTDRSLDQDLPLTTINNVDHETKIRRSPTKPTLNPHLLNKSKYDNTGGELSENCINIARSETRNASSKDFTNQEETLVQEIVSASSENVTPFAAKTIVNQELLIKDEQIDIKEETTNSQENSDCTGEFKSEGVIDIPIEQEAVKSLDQTPKFNISRRALIKPMLSKKLLSKIKQKEPADKGIKTELFDVNNSLECSSDILQEEFQIQCQQTESTSCFDILQADIVIPGAIVKDDKDQVINQQHIVIPAYDNNLESSHIGLLNDRLPSNEFILCDNDTLENTHHVNSSANHNESSEISNVKQNELKPPLEIGLQESFFVKPSVNDNLLLPYNHDKDMVEQHSDYLNTAQLEVQSPLQNSPVNDYKPVTTGSENEGNISNDLENSEGGTQPTHLKAKPFRRIFSKPTLIKKSPGKRIEVKIEDNVDTTKDSLNMLHLPQEVSYDSQSDVLQFDELEIASLNASEMPTESNQFVRPAVNRKITTSKSDEQASSGNCSNQKDESFFDPDHIMPLVRNPVRMFGRSRIKAVPRLDQRHVGASLYGSTSDSEDDVCRKRIRTESASSACSSMQVVNDNEFEYIEPGKDIKPITRRKSKRSEQVRRIAEARRNFVMKFGKGGIPDKQQLTMMDLIYYNPCTEPMSQSPLKPRNENISEEKPQLNSTETIKTDKENEVTKEDEDDAIPAPQIKIGINGEIIIDEQSLVIENAQTRKSREELQKSDIVNGDFDTGYGVFKRAKRTRDWTKLETMHFYKALSIVGTDFTLMTDFFHNRTRRDLKIKFKKEERHNLTLVDKALSHRSNYSMKDLHLDSEKLKLLTQPDPENEEILRKTNEYIKTSQRKSRSGRVVRTKETTNSRSILERRAASLGSSTSDAEEASESVKKRRRKRRRVVRLKPRLTIPNNHNLDISNILKQTRSGRVPKPKQHFDSHNTPVQQPPSNGFVIPEEFKNLPAGSLMILTFPSPTGQLCYKVYMVTAGQAKVPVTLTNDVINNLTQSTESTVTIPEHAMLIEQSTNAVSTVGTSNVDHSSAEDAIMALAGSSRLPNEITENISVS